MAPETVSLETSLTERYEAQLATAELSRQQAKEHLSRLALIYSGQMHFDFEAAQGGQTA